MQSKKSNETSHPRILYLYSDQKRGGIFHYRVKKPLETLRSEGMFVDYLDSRMFNYGNMSLRFWEAALREYNMIICKHIQHDSTWDIVNAVCSQENKILVNDFDDNLFKVDSSNPNKEYFEEGTRLSIMAKQQIEKSDALIVSTHELQDEYSQYHDNIFVLPNLYDAKDYPQKRQFKEELVNQYIFWGGSTSHELDLAMIMPAIRQLLTDKKNVMFVTMGYHPDAGFMSLTKDQVENQWLRLSSVPSFAEYAKAITHVPATIAIAPLTDTLFNRGKSAIKYFEYASQGIPVVASDIGTYYPITHKETGLLAKNNPIDWYACMDLLLEDEALRNKLAHKALNSIHSDFSYTRHAKLFSETMKSIFSKTKKTV